MRPTRVRFGLSGFFTLVTIVGTATAADEPKGTLRDGFESPRTAWKQEQTDANLTLQAHDRSARAAHGGQTSERFEFTAGVGSSFYYSYDLPKVPVADGLKVGLFVRSNRTGVQLFARVILPNDIDPETKLPSFLLVPGTIYEDADRWQRLELLEMPTSLERQARVLRAASKRKVSLEGAYIAQLVVNLYTSAGPTEVFLDDLSVGPVPAALLAGFPSAGGPPTPRPDARPSGIESPATLRPQAVVRLDSNRLKKRSDDGLYHDWVPTAIYAPGADVTSLRDAGFDLLIHDLQGDRKRAEEAVKLGFQLMTVFARDADGKVLDAAKAYQAAASFPLAKSVAAWDMGDGLGRGATIKVRTEELEAVRAIASKLRDLPDGVSKLLTGIVDDDLRRYARAGTTLKLLGIRPASWGSSVSPGDMFSYLKQRRDLTVLSNGGALYWAMLPATAPPSIPSAIWGRDVPPAWGYPVVQPDQLRIMTYAALGAGYRGIAYRGDAELTRPDGPGRMLWLEMSLLNAEVDLVESVIANGADPIPVYMAFPPDPPALPPPGSQVGQRTPVKPEPGPLPGIKAAGLGLPYRKGVLLIMGDYAGMGQFQPPQAARNNVKMTIVVPEGALAYEISPGRFKAVEESEKYVGGRRLTLPEFDSTSLILVTTDTAMAQRVEEVVKSIRPRAAVMAIEQAERKLAWTTEIVQMLASQGHYLILEKERAKREATGGAPPTDQNDLLNLAAKNIKAARENLEREDYANAWSEARRASRPLRLLMRLHWENAQDAMTKANMLPEDVANENLILLGKVKRKGPLQIVPPVASAPLVAFNTLPQHYVWVDTMQNSRFGPNLVPSGSFDKPKLLEKAGWVSQGVQYEDVKSQIKPFGDPKGPRKQWLYFAVEPVSLDKVDTLPPSLCFPAAAIRSPAVKVRAGEFFKISVDVERRLQSAPGPGGIVIRDSIGGEALQFSSVDPMPAFTKIILYRRAPSDGELTVTLGLAGYGGCFFDDFKIQRAESPGAPDDSELASAPRPVAPPPTARREPAVARPSR